VTYDADVAAGVGIRARVVGPAGRAAVPLLVFMLAGGPGTAVLVDLLAPEVAHVCACSLEAGHHCRCVKCLGEAHVDHDDADGPAYHDTDCDDDDHAAGLIKLSSVPVPTGRAAAPLRVRQRVELDIARADSRPARPPSVPPPIRRGVA